MGNLDNLATQIRLEHGRAMDLAKDALQHALEAGRLLIKVKTEVGHGNWLPWLGANCPEISTRQAQRYVRLAEKAPLLGDATRVSHLSIRGALALLSEPKPEPESQLREPSIERDGFELPDMRTAVMGCAEPAHLGEGALWIWIRPSTADGFYHVAMCDFNASTMEGSKKGIRRDGVLYFIEAVLLHFSTRKLAAFRWLSEPCEPTDWNIELFPTRTEYKYCALGITPQTRKEKAIIARCQGGT